MSDTNIVNAAGTSDRSRVIAVETSSSANHTAHQVLAGVKANMTPSKKVNSQPHRNTGSQWVVHGTNSTLSANAQALVQNALNTLGNALGLRAPAIS